jgi:hypothetical protein
MPRALLRVTPPSTQTSSDATADDADLGDSIREPLATLGFRFAWYWSRQTVNRTFEWAGLLYVEDGVRLAGPLADSAGREVPGTS